MTFLRSMHDPAAMTTQASVGVLMTIGAFPWVIKPVYGFLSDSVPLLGYKRRSYLVVCGLLGATLHLQPCSMRGKNPSACTEQNNQYAGWTEGVSRTAPGVSELRAVRHRNRERLSSCSADG